MSAQTFELPAPPRKRGVIRRHKVFAGVLGFVLFLTAGALASWLIIPDSPGFGYGKADDAVVGLALESVVIQNGDPALGATIGPNETGTVLTRWRNANAFVVSITEVRHVTGTPIQKVGDASCTAPPSTFNITPATGSFAVGMSGGTRDVSLDITTTNDFPGCLAGGSFRMEVLAKAQPA